MESFHEGCGANAAYGMHEYAVVECPSCGREFCWNCCGGTNVHEGGKYDPDYMFCPGCGRDVYSDKNMEE